MVEQFNLKIHVDYLFRELQVNEVKLISNYTFYLYEGFNEKFGQINYIYECVVPESYHIIVMIVRSCMNSNGNNVRNLIIDSLADEGICFKEFLK